MDLVQGAVSRESVVSHEQGIAAQCIARGVLEKREVGGGGVRHFGLEMASFTIVRAHGDHFFSFQCSIWHSYWRILLSTDILLARELIETRNSTTITVQLRADTFFIVRPILVFPGVLGTTFHTVTSTTEIDRFNSRECQLDDQK